MSTPLPSKHIIILASGGGSNAKCIIDYLHGSSRHIISAVFSNKQSAGVLDKAQKAGIEAIYQKGSELPQAVLDYADHHQVDAVVLAGYLRLIPPSLIQRFPNRIVNIHPSLLPKFGGKGMYGHHVHQAVFDAKEQESGMTIHVVNAEYDKGEILSQAKIDITDCQTPEEIGSRVLSLEHFHYPRVVKTWLDGLNPPV